MFFEKFGNFRSLSVNMTKTCLVFFTKIQSFEITKLKKKKLKKKPPLIHPSVLLLSGQILHHDEFFF
jgi:hypothetical protein